MLLPPVDFLSLTRDCPVIGTFDQFILACSISSRLQLRFTSLSFFEYSVERCSLRRRDLAFSNFLLINFRSSIFVQVASLIRSSFLLFCYPRISLLISSIALLKLWIVISALSFSKLNLFFREIANFVRTSGLLSLVVSKRLFSAGTMSHFSEFQSQFCYDEMVVASYVSRSPNPDIIQ